MKPEARIQRHIIKLMRDKLGFSVWDLSQDRPTRQTAGIPDLIISGYGRHFHVEVKTPKGRETPGQVDFRETANANGGLSLVWRSDVDAWDWCVREGIIEESPEAA